MFASGLIFGGYERFWLIIFNAAVAVTFPVGSMWKQLCRVCIAIYIRSRQSSSQVIIESDYIRLF